MRGGSIIPAGRNYEFYNGPVMPESPQEGAYWGDTVNDLAMYCTSIAPVTFMAIGLQGGVAAHALGGLLHTGVLSASQHGAIGPIAAAHGHDDLDTVGPDDHHIAFTPAQHAALPYGHNPPMWGLPGMDGEDGQMGLPGPTGAVGVQGNPGTPGDSGAAGPPGVDGEDGEVGPIGPSGLVGSVGPQGEHGAPGMDGEDGFDGLPGIRGDTGPAGIMGPSGQAGEDGNDGIDGVPGQIGNTGSGGPQGLPGWDGEDGFDGIMGRLGVDGRDGLQGTPGRDGEDGDSWLSPASAHEILAHQGFPGGTSTFLRADRAFASPTASVADPNPQSYTPGSFTVDTGKYVILCNRLNLTGVQRATVVGTARVRIT